MKKKIQLNEKSIIDFTKRLNSISANATLSYINVYPTELLNVGEKNRNQYFNCMLGTVNTRPKKNTLVLEIVNFDKKEQKDNGDYYVFIDREEPVLTKHTPTEFFKEFPMYSKHIHKETKNYLRE